MNPSVLALPIVLVATIAQAQAQAQPAAPAVTRFDGAWTVRIQCPSNSEDSGAKGYAYSFPATVKDGLLSGSHGEEGSAGSLKIEGPIQSDGDATLQARGRTGNPDYAVKRPASGSPYSYTIKAHFDASSGTGSRMEARVCNFTFAR
jgi:hypothetical protein